ncbi:hypothetical protein ABZ297_09425 [Nonomuraea sp. NPDC005983]|uniref:hypothetical protein n=1 Tax=Nonomuraea sp. NPDC005983 TaxID=3155595 RepID=UPI0033A620D6
MIVGAAMLVTVASIMSRASASSTNPKIAHMRRADAIVGGPTVAGVAMTHLHSPEI